MQMLTFRQGLEQKYLSNSVLLKAQLVLFLKELHQKELQHLFLAFLFLAFLPMLSSTH